MKTFHDAFCERFGIPPEAFEEEVLWRCFYPHAVWLGKLFWHMNRRYFNADFELIRQVADCTTETEIRGEITDFRYHQPITGFFRRVLRIRLSGQQIVNLGAKLLPVKNEDSAPQPPEAENSL